jgi:threonine aldolase
MLAKGRLLGIQFRELLRDGLYFDLARHANAMAARLRDGMLAKGYPFPLDSRTNQLFPVLPNAGGGGDEPELRL